MINLFIAILPKTLLQNPSQPFFLSIIHFLVFINLLHNPNSITILLLKSIYPIIMTHPPQLLTEFITTLQQQNKSKIHQISLLTQQLAQVLSANEYLKQQQQRLIMSNTEQQIIIEKQEIGLLMMDQVIGKLKQSVRMKEWEEEAMRREFDELWRKLNDFERRERQVRGNSANTNMNDDQKEYNLLSTNHFFSKIETRSHLLESQITSLQKQKERNKRQQQLTLDLQKSSTMILTLSEQLKSLQNQLSNYRSQNQHLHKLNTDLQQQQIKSQQQIYKMNHAEESLQLANVRNEELAKQIKGLIDIRHNLEISNNMLVLSNQELEKALGESRNECNRVTMEMKEMQDKLGIKVEQIEKFNQIIINLDKQILNLKSQNQNFFLQCSTLRSQLQFTLANRIDLAEHLALKNQHQQLKIKHEKLIQQFQSQQSNLLSISKIQQHLRTEIKQEQSAKINTREQVSNLITINHTLSSQLNIMRERLAEQQRKNKEILRLEKANRQLMKRVELLQASMTEKRRKSSTKIDSLLHIPSTTTIPPYISSTRQNPNRSNLYRMRSQENLLPKSWSRQIDSKETKVSSRVNNIFSSRREVDRDAVEKMKWRNLQERIDTLKERNEDLREYMEVYRI